MRLSIVQQKNPVLRASFPLLVIFLFAVFSACFEMVPFISKLRPMLFLAVLGLMAVVASGRAVVVLRSPVTWTVGLFTIWFILCIPFGLWPGGSFFVFTDQWSKSALIYVVIVGLLTTIPQSKRIFHSVAYAVGFMAIYALVKGGQTEGRLILDNTRFGNPNDLAWTLIVGLTFLGYLFIRGRRGQKTLAAILTLPVLVALLKTGSRAGSLGIVVLVFVVFLQSSRRGRMKLGALLVGAMVLFLITASPELRMRFTTYFGAVDQTETTRLSAEAIGSAEARKQLLKDSLQITAMHPLLGVGPGNFVVAQDVLAHERGQKSMWHVTHNTYTQLSSEMGIPGLVIYLAFLIQAFKTLNSIVRTRTRSPSWSELQSLAATLRAVLSAFMVVAFFSSLAYNIDTPVLVGIATALGMMARKQRAIDRAEKLSASPEKQHPLIHEPAGIGQ